MYDQARAVFEDIHKKQLDWPELIWELWITFEHLHGTVDQVDECLYKVEKAQAHVIAKRAKVRLPGHTCKDYYDIWQTKEAEKASYQAMQEAMASQSVPASNTEITAPIAVENQMEVDNQIERGMKRSAEEDIAQDAQKKPKTGRYLPPLFHDCTWPCSIHRRTAGPTQKAKHLI